MVDDSLSEFPIFYDFAEGNILANQTNQFYSNDGSFLINLEQLESQDIDKVLITSNEFSPLRNGLSNDSEQGGKCYSVNSYPDYSNFEETYITFNYSDSDLEMQSESTLRIFNWSFENEKWEIVGGIVDTTRNEVTSPIVHFGVYAAFTTKDTPPTGGSLNDNNIYIYPNPFNPLEQDGTIRYSLAEDGDVTIKIYDIGGNRARTLIEDVPQSATDEQSIAWDGKNDKGKIVANGVYFYVIESSSGEKATGKAAVIR